MDKSPLALSVFLKTMALLCICKSDVYSPMKDMDSTSLRHSESPSLKSRQRSLSLPSYFRNPSSLMNNPRGLTPRV